MLQRKLSALEVRKQLLIAESELNRKLLAREYKVLDLEVRSRFHPAQLATAAAGPILDFISKFRSHHAHKTETLASKSLGWAGWLLRTGLGLWLGAKGNRDAAETNGESKTGWQDEVSSY